ncbi:MAG: adenylate kinase [Spirochaetes bacterium GWF1_31_7]|nr:MAG: adenylate kinase [Spirochaetes bacterium GWE1_32_154]OHD51582.1 MAG: adenylate kinase [Spirochaetes bacterium GWE2_31_10]OHD52984.1 MAG: adenylate kinase [Spirochaetes bacterium GWF1_31_7]OHD82206.1 MAG: adenylate kinase [Spirochaetes bacterium RIFOXYB1_FULL_32_8]HBD93729.1 adenylate kinase [Spirochaetia bacterium]
MNLIFFGAPGAGKGTIAKMLKDRENLVHISTGDIFRTAIKNKTELGLKVTSILDKGELVPDELTISLVSERVKEPDCKSGYILDGFPRTLVQAEAWSKEATIDAAVYFDISDDEVVRRLCGRRTCPNCHSIFHVEFNKPKKDGICDVCNSELIIRPDDSNESINNRLKVYHTQTEPLVEYFTKLQKVIVINAVQNSEKVYSDIAGKIK